jgi:hypothetical protein
MGIITVLMKAEQGTIFTETSALVSYCSNNFTLFRADNVLDYAKAIPTEDGDAQVMASPADGFYILTRNGDDIDSYTRTYDLPEKISAPVYENDKLGTLTFYNGEAAVGKVDMVSLSSYGTGSETDTATAETQITTAGKDSAEGSAFVKLATKLLLIILILILVFSIIYAGIIIFSVSTYNKRRKRKLERRNTANKNGSVRGPEPYGESDNSENKDTVKK